MHRYHASRIHHCKWLLQKNQSLPVSHHKFSVIFCFAECISQDWSNGLLQSLPLLKPLINQSLSFRHGVPTNACLQKYPAPFLLNLSLAIRYSSYSSHSIPEMLDTHNNADSNLYRHASSHHHGYQ